MPRKDPSERLRLYREKRSADRTPEPFGGPAREDDAPATSASTPTPAAAARVGAARGGLFVVQKHRARQLHYDFRLELDSVLRSWAVPKGPSPDITDKRLAVEVEDHPLEYADFEGIIPAGNYGAGAVVLWDRGRWVPKGDPEEALAHGKLLFSLHGYKLRGLWTLVKSKRGPKEWLLIKERDAYEGAEAKARLGEASILSGLTVEELAEGHGRADDAARELERRGVKCFALGPGDVKLMLAETAKAPFTKDGWIFELKYDGWRVLAGRSGGSTILLSRGGHDLSASFPEIAKAIRALPFEAVLDGEIVVLDADGVPRFSLLQKRGLLSDAAAVERATIELPASLQVFDLPAFAGFDLRDLPLRERKAVLASVLPPQGALRYVDHIEREGTSFHEAVAEARLEGVMAKSFDSPYRAGRSTQWLKIKIDRTGDFVVVGLHPSKDGGPSFGSLHVAVHDGGSLVYAGRVGSGLTPRELAAIEATVRPLRRTTPPCTGSVPKTRGELWCEPALVAEVRYKEFTPDGLLRQPAFLRLRDDKRPGDCTRDNPHTPEAGTESAPAEGGRPSGDSGSDGTTSVASEASSAASSTTGGPRPASRRAPPKEGVRLGNVGKVFWPEDGYTKGDLLSFYRDVGPWLLPYLADRPLVLTRFPDGIHGKSFFQQNAPDFVPGWIRKERMWSEQAEKEVAHFVADDLDSLLYLVNLGTIPLHVWSSRVANLQHPDWSILDLDPKGAPFADVVAIARRIHEISEEIGLPSFPKTSGSTGLHVLVPLGGALTYAESRSLAELLARVVVEELPDIATIVRTIAARGGRVYLDFGQNGHGRLLVAPLSVRPLAGAPVSTPLTWDEVGPSLDPKQFTIRTVVPRLERNGDPLKPVLTTAPDLASAIARLAARVHGGG